MTTKLKIKIKSLAAEARIIRMEERKELARKRRRHDPDRSLYESLHRHRTHDVRRVTREAHLAYGYLRGVPYERMETTRRTTPNFSAVQKLAERFSPEKVDRGHFWGWTGAVRAKRSTERAA